jgi:soluble lytic murein transglycosylase-like protein
MAIPVLALAANAAAASSAAAALAPPRYACTLIDGSVRVLGRDLSHSFKQGVRGCWLLEPNETLVERAPARRNSWRPGPSAVLPVELPPSGDAAEPNPLPKSAQALVLDVSRRHALDPHLVAAVVYVESRGQARARSPKGALGMMQVMPGTGRRYGVQDPASLLDPATNLDTGARYLRDLLAMFPGRLDLTLAAYNAGEGAVLRHGRRIPPYAETQAYVRSVLGRYRAARAASTSVEP